MVLCLLIYLFNGIKENERGITSLLKRRKEKESKIADFNTAPLSLIFFSICRSECSNSAALSLL